MYLWHLNNMKIILLNFHKDYCFWTLLKPNYSDFFPFSSILSIWLTIKPNSLGMLYYRILEEHDQTFIFVKGVLQNQSCSSVNLSVCLSVCLWCIFIRIYPVDFLKYLDEDILSYILKSGKAIFWKIALSR